MARIRLEGSGTGSIFDVSFDGITSKDGSGRLVPNVPVGWIVFDARLATHIAWATNICQNVHGYVEAREMADEFVEALCNAVNNGPGCGQIRAQDAVWYAASSLMRKRCTCDECTVSRVMDGLGG